MVFKTDDGVIHNFALRVPSTMWNDMRLLVKNKDFKNYNQLIVHAIDMIITEHSEQLKHYREEDIKEQILNNKDKEGLKWD